MEKIMVMRTKIQKKLVSMLFLKGGAHLNKDQKFA